MTPETRADTVECQICGHRDRGCEVKTENVGGNLVKSWWSCATIAARKARITGIGNASKVDGQWRIEHWVTEGGEYPAVDYTNGRVGGWWPEELHLLREVAIAWGHSVALDLAERVRNA